MEGTGAAGEFPHGCFYENADGMEDLQVFTRICASKRHVEAVPRVDSRGQLCGAMYRTMSGHDLSSSAVV